MWLIGMTSIYFTLSFRRRHVRWLRWEYQIYSREVFTCIVTVLKYVDNQPIKYILYSRFEMQYLGNMGRLCREYQIYSREVFTCMPTILKYVDNWAN